MNRSQPIEDMSVPVWDITANALTRRLCGTPIYERLDRIRSEVSHGQNRFRQVYAIGVRHEDEEAGNDCPAMSEPHFHGRVKRIGHLPMFTVKELPE